MQRVHIRILCKKGNKSIEKDIMKNERELKRVNKRS